ncbi:MAG: hypothetical protein Q7J47_16125 [Azoarcus sp.]|nr:hypothetical protein [Azoarcus sp.]
MSRSITVTEADASDSRCGRRLTDATMGSSLKKRSSLVAAAVPADTEPRKATMHPAHQSKRRALGTGTGEIDGQVHACTTAVEIGKIRFLDARIIGEFLLLLIA